MGRRLVAAAFGFAAVSAWFAVIPLTLLTALLPPSRYPSRLSHSSETSDASAWFETYFFSAWSRHGTPPRRGCRSLLSYAGERCSQAPSRRSRHASPRHGCRRSFVGVKSACYVLCEHKTSAAFLLKSLVCRTAAAGPH